jgi:hypothetical protein
MRVEQRNVAALLKLSNCRPALGRSKMKRNLHPKLLKGEQTGWYQKGISALVTPGKHLLKRLFNPPPKDMQNPSCS